MSKYKVEVVPGLMQLGFGWEVPCYHVTVNGHRVASSTHMDRARERAIQAEWWVNILEQADTIRPPSIITRDPAKAAPVGTGLTPQDELKIMSQFAMDDGLGSDMATYETIYRNMIRVLDAAGYKVVHK